MATTADNTTPTTTPATTPAATPAAPAKPKTVAENFPSRRLFANAEEAAAFLNASREGLADFDGQSFAMAGFDDEGNFRSDVYGDGMRVMVAKLMNRGDKDASGNRAPSTVKAIVIAPVPTLDSLLADDAGKAWVQKIIDKELNHVAVRDLRDADKIEDVVDKIPLTREAYISSQRDTGGIMDTFNELYRSINATLSGKVKSWDKARLIKSEMKKAMESAAYAAEYYPTLEDRGEGKDSLFVTAIKIGQSAAKRAGLAPDIFDRWLATRDAAKFTPDADEDEDEELDVDALAADMKLDAPAESNGEQPAPAQDAQAPAEQPAPTA